MDVTATIFKSEDGKMKRGGIARVEYKKKKKAGKTSTDTTFK